MAQPRTHRGHAPTDREGIPVGRRVRLPRGAQRPIRVYINGIEQREGTDFRLERGEVVFAEPIVKEGELSKLRWLAIWTGLFGSYRKNETVDVEYRLGDATHLASDLEVIPD